MERDLREGELVGGAEDSAVVLRFLDTYLKPMQVTMLAVAPDMKLDQAQSNDRLKLLPLLMKVNASSIPLGLGTFGPTAAGCSQE